MSVDSAAQGGGGGSSAPAAVNLDRPSSVRKWLSKNHPKQLALLDQFEISLRLGRFSSRGCDESKARSSQHQTYQYGREREQVTLRTLELLRSIVGSTRWQNAAQLLTLLRGLGNELHGLGGDKEPAIGNMVRRIMCAVRDEADRVTVTTATRKDDGMGKIDELSEQVSSKMNISGSRESNSSLASMLWAHPQQISKQHSRHPGEFDDRLRSDSLASDPGDSSVSASKSCEDQSVAQVYPPHYYQRRDDLRSSVMEALQEMMGELEDLHKSINDQAVQHIHAGEIILTYALSKTVELVSPESVMLKSYGIKSSQSKTNASF